MSLHVGGIFSRARGKASGLVFSEVRTRQGKGMISRQLVIPSNPNSPGQQDQRLKFSRMKQSLATFGRNSYEEVLDRGVGQLPGYQTFENMLLNSLQDDGTLSAIPDVATGNTPGWSGGTIDYGVSNPSDIIVTVQGGTSGYETGTTLHCWAWVDFDGDWRTLDDTQWIYKPFTIVSSQAEIINVLPLDQDLIAVTSQALVYVMVQFPANSPRRRSKTRSILGVRGEIQDMKNSGKV